MRKKLKKAVQLIFIMTLLLSGPICLINILDISLSLKYEVSHPIEMGHDNPSLRELENYYNLLLTIFGIIMIAGPVVGITMIVRKFRSFSRR